MNCLLSFIALSQISSPSVFLCIDFSCRMDKLVWALLKFKMCDYFSIIGYKCIFHLQAKSDCFENYWFHRWLYLLLQSEMNNIYQCPHGSNGYFVHKVLVSLCSVCHSIASITFNILFSKLLHALVPSRFLRDR